MEFERPGPSESESSGGRPGKDKDKSREGKKRRKKSRAPGRPAAEDSKKSSAKPLEKSLGETWRELAAKKKEGEPSKEKAKKEPQTAAPETDEPKDLIADKELRRSDKPEADQTEPDAKKDTEDETDTGEESNDEAPHADETSGEVVTVELDEIVEWEIPLRGDAEDTPPATAKTPLESEPKQRPERPPADEVLPEAEVISQDIPDAAAADGSPGSPQNTRYATREATAPPPGAAQPPRDPNYLARSESIVDESLVNLPPPIWSQQAELADQTTAVNPNKLPTVAAVDKNSRKINRLKRDNRRRKSENSHLGEQSKFLRRESAEQNRRLGTLDEAQARTATELREVRKGDRETREMLEGLRREYNDGPGGWPAERLWHDEPAGRFAGFTVPEAAPAAAAVEAVPTAVLAPEHFGLKRTASPLEDLPPEALAIAERLRVPPEHRLEHSAWHTIEVDKKTGQVAEEPAFAYGEEFKREQSQEAWQPAEAATPAARSGQTMAGVVADVGMLPIPQPATTDVPAPKPQSTPTPDSANITIHERRQVVSNAGDLGLAFVLIVIVVAIIVIASS